MASLSPSSLTNFYSLLLLLLLFSATLSTNTATNNPQAGFAVKLTRMSPYTSFQRTPVASSQGDFLTQIQIGTPPRNVSAVMDTGSDLTWTQCEPLIGRSSSLVRVPCYSDLCSKIHNGSCHNGCSYYASYADGTYTRGSLITDTIRFASLAHSGIALGCATDNAGFSNREGLLGLGRGRLSLISQLRIAKFSYCLPPIDSDTAGFLRVGTKCSVPNDSRMKTTSLLTPLNPSYQPYYVNLVAITVGSTRIEVTPFFKMNRDGSGGFRIDSGTTYTTLPSPVFGMVINEFVNQTNLTTTDQDGFSCFEIGTGDVEFPGLIFNFEGADLEIPQENYIFDGTASCIKCLGLLSGDDRSVLGNFQQQNTLVIHNLKEETVSFLSTNCEAV